MSKQDNSNALATLATSAENKEVKANPAGGFDAYYNGAKVAGPFTYSWEAMNHLHRLSYAPARQPAPTTPEAAPPAVAFADLTPENASTAKMPSGMGYDSRCKWIAKRDYLIGRDAPITPAASTPAPAARELLAMPEGVPEPPTYFDGMQRVQWAIDHGYTGATTAPATEALETPAPAVPYVTTYKAGRDPVADARAILDADKAAGIWTDEHARASILADQLTYALSMITKCRDLGDALTGAKNAEGRRIYYDKATQWGLRAGELESELAEALANIAAGDTSPGPWIEESADDDTDPLADEPAYTPDHNYYGRSDEPAWAPDDDTDELIAAGMLEIKPDDYRPEDDPTVMARYHAEMQAQTEYEAELYAQEYAAGVDEAHGYKGVPMQFPIRKITLPAVETSTTAAELPAALYALKTAAARRDSRYAERQQSKANLDELESHLIGQIASEATDAGKAVYSNDAARKAELKARLALYPNITHAYEDAEAQYIVAKTNYDMAEQELKTLRAVLSYETQVLAMQTEIMAGQRQARAADDDDLPF